MGVFSEINLMMREQSEPVQPFMLEAQPESTQESGTLPETAEEAKAREQLQEAAAAQNLPDTQQPNETPEPKQDDEQQNEKCHKHSRGGHQTGGRERNCSGNYNCQKENGDNPTEVGLFILFVRLPSGAVRLRQWKNSFDCKNEKETAADKINLTA